MPTPIPQADYDAIADVLARFEPLPPPPPPPWAPSLSLSGSGESLTVEPNATHPSGNGTTVGYRVAGQGFFFGEGLSPQIVTVNGAALVNYVPGQYTIEMPVKTAIGAEDLGTATATFTLTSEVIDEVTVYTISTP